MAKIKICGLRTPEDVKIVNELKPDFVGFILTKGFRRTITKETAKILQEQIDPSIKIVGVFVNEDIKNVEFFVNNGIIDLVQLHGNEDVEYIKKINAPVIKVLKPESFSEIREYEKVTDCFLFDSGTGTGKTFDWDFIPKTNKPFFLAGGISKDNLRCAIENIKPYGVDMSSSVETDGKKDFNKVKEVIKIVREINE